MYGYCTHLRKRGCIAVYVHRQTWITSMASTYLLTSIEDKRQCRPPTASALRTSRSLERSLVVWCHRPDPSQAAHCYLMSSLPRLHGCRGWVFDNNLIKTPASLPRFSSFMAFAILHRLSSLIHTHLLLLLLPTTPPRFALHT